MGLVSPTPSRLSAAGRTRAAVRATELLDAGEVSLARGLAAGAVDATRKVGPDPGARAAGLTPGRARLVAALALDEALAAGDGRAARRRAVSTHLGLEQAAARALAFGEPALAREIASELLAADPRSTAAALVVWILDEDAAAAGAAPSSSPATPLPRLSGPLPAALAVVLTERLLRTAGAEAAARFFEGVSREPVSGVDGLLVSRLVDLAARGVLTRAELPPEGRVELAARLGPAASGPPEALAALDAPHAYLCAALADPRSEATRALGARASASHPAAVVAAARVALASGRAAEPALWTRVAVAAPEPLVLAARLELARARGDAPAEATARTLLAARAGTEHERRLVAPR